MDLELTWCRNLRLRDVEEWKNLQVILDSVCLSMDSMDSFSWAFSKDETFLVKLLTWELDKLSPLVNSQTSNWRKIWRGHIPPKINLFMWLALRGKLNTKMKLVHMNILHYDDTTCVLCKDHQESSDYLFLHCSFPKNIWCWWLDIWGLHWLFSPPPSRSLREMVHI